MEARKYNSHKCLLCYGQRRSFDQKRVNHDPAVDQLPMIVHLSRNILILYACTIQIKDSSETQHDKFVSAQFGTYEQPYLSNRLQHHSMYEYRHLQVRSLPYPQPP